MAIPVRKPTSRGISDPIIKWSFVLPTIALLVVMNIFPLIWSLVLSFTDYTPGGGDWNWVGAANYEEILSDEDFWQSFSVTSVYVFASVTLQMLVGFGLALFVHRKFPGKGLVTTLFLMPMMMSPVIVGLFWRYLYSPAWGLVNHLFGLEVDWLSDDRFTIWAVVIVDVWMWAPFVMLLSIAGLSAIPGYLYEAAEIDRASAWQKFVHITLPMVSPLLLLALVFRTMEAFKTFDLALGVAKSAHSAPKLVSLQMYEMAFVKWDMGKACALAYVVLILIVAISNIYITYLDKLSRR
jgi:multiple sugar transport system permease protein